MAGAFVSSAAADVGASYTPGSGTDTIAIWVGGSIGAGTTTASNQTLGGTSMTEPANQDQSIDLAGNGDPTGFLAHLVNPGTSPLTTAVTWASSRATDNGRALTLSGIDQTTPVYATNGSQGNTYTGTASPSIGYDAPVDSVVVCWVIHANSSAAITWTSPTGFTQAGQTDIITSPARRQISIWYKAVSSAEVASTVSPTANNSGDGLIGVVTFQAPAAAGVTVALTGVSGTYSVGSVAVEVSKALTGNATTYSLGTLTPQIPVTVALTGIGSTYSVGSVQEAISVALSGVSATYSTGSVSPSVSLSLSGNQAVYSVDSVSPSLSKALTGVSSAYSVGSVSPSISVALTGVSSTYSAGILSTVGDITIALTGVSSAYSVGSLTPSSSKAISGVSATYSVDSLSPNISKDLTGVSSSQSVGSLIPSASKALSGVSALYSVGSVGLPAEFFSTFAVIGQIVTSGIGLKVSLSSTGQGLSVSQVSNVGLTGAINENGSGVIGSISTIGRGLSIGQISNFAVKSTISNQGQGVLGEITETGQGENGKI